MNISMSRFCYWQRLLLQRKWTLVCHGSAKVGLPQRFAGRPPGKLAGSLAESTKHCRSSCPWQRRVRPCKAFAQISALVASLTWIEYKIFTLCYRSRDSSAPAYLSDLLSVYQPSCSLRSADTGLMIVLRIKLNKYGKRASSYIGPVTWNSLPKPLRDAPSLPSFKSNLKTLLFKKHLYWRLSQSDPQGCWAKLTVSCTYLYISCTEQAQKWLS